ncbi:MAG: NAD(+)/NADH kinase [Gammaproteobacteria bacterium]|nr:NAD(+)/NADH kinase [Gammaproteobacteria bacterium]
MPALKTIGIIAKRRDPRVMPTLLRICRALVGRGADVLIDADPPPRTLPPGMRAVSRDQLARSCELALVIGGDGTLLDAGRSLAPHDVPLLGINQGRLGFLTDVRPDDIDAVLDEIERGEVSQESRLMLAVYPTSNGGDLPRLLAVNDAVLRTLASIRMLDFQTWLRTAGGDWEFISRHRADGLIVSTPTGSTAYALSGGGPVLHPDLHALALVPICPHTLSDRPVVVPADRRIRIVLRADTDGAALTCDGQVTLPLAGGDCIEIERCEHPLRLIHPRGYDYFDLLRDKLRWGHGPEQVPSERL